MWVLILENVVVGLFGMIVRFVLDGKLFGMYCLFIS